MDSPTPSVLMIYYSYTHQTERVMEAMTEVLNDRGCHTTLAHIEFTDPRYEKRFNQFPMPRPFREVVAMIPAELRHRPARIGIPDTVVAREHDFIILGSPTWWLSTNVPMRSFLESAAAAQVLKGRPFTGAVCCRRYWKHNLKTLRRMGTKQGGTYVDGIHFRYQGGQIRSLLSLVSFLGTGEYRQRFHGVTIPPTNLQENHLDEARRFAASLADRLTNSARAA